MRRFLRFALLALVGSSCADSVIPYVPPIEDLPRPSEVKSCTAAPADRPEALADCGVGGGVFGFWRLDDAGLPAYEYTLDHLTDARARYRHSQSDDRRDHLHQLGNDRVNGVATNDGQVILASQERGVTLHNRIDAAAGNHGGGFSVIGEQGRAWNTAYRYRPAGAQARRTFGMGYVEYVTQHEGVRVTRRVVAPPGDDPLLVDEVVVENLSATMRHLRHYEVWDANRHQLKFQQLRTGPLAAPGDASRNALNTPFDQRVTLETGVLMAEYLLRPGEERPPPGEVSSTNHYPQPIFLASLGEAPVQVYTDQKAFYGKGGPASPDGASLDRQGEILPLHPAWGQPTSLVMRHDLALGPRESRKLRFAFGYLPGGKDLKVLDRHRDPKVDPLTAVQLHWKQQVAYFASPEAPELSREIPWHAYYLLSSTLTLDYFQTLMTPQGSAYLYLHGLDGAPRDQALFALPLVYLRPELARGNLRLIMGMTKAADGAISYAYHGHGVLEHAVAHRYPSDLDLFFMLAMSEYLAATGDRAFLAEEVRFHPREAAPAPGAAGYTVLDHVRAAVEHLITVVGRGQHGLIRVGDGDWSDGVVWQDETKFDTASTIQHGESVPNTQMALYVLPRLATLIEREDAALATRMRRYAEELEAPARAEFQGEWFARAWLRDREDQPVHLGTGSVDLEAQPWGLLSGLLSAEQEQKVLDRVYGDLDQKSPLGPPLTAGGQVWPGVSQLMTWAYTKREAQRAWQSLVRQSYATKAKTYPEIWFGIWSAPDGTWAKSGQTWTSVATPMTDWPVMNMNPDAMYLFGTLRVAGVEPYGRGLRIQPTGVPAQLTLDTKLLRLATRGGETIGEYRAQNGGELVLTLAAPRGQKVVEVLVAGKRVEVPAGGADQVEAPLAFAAGQKVSFAFRWK